MKNYGNFLDVFELQIKYQEMRRDGIWIAICTVDLELESGRVSLIRIWDNKDFTSLPESTKYVFREWSFLLSKPKGIHQMNELQLVQNPNEWTKAIQDKE